MATSALRSVLSAIANAEAVGPSPSRFRIGIGAGDVARRELSSVEILAIIQAEIDERLHAADEYDRREQRERAHRLRSEGEFLEAVVAGLASQ